MAGRRTSKINIDMFPFLSVLCSVIGVMMLLIVLVLSTRAEHVEEQLAVAATPMSNDAPPTEVGIPDEAYEALRSRILSMATVLGERQGELRQLNKLILELEDLIAAKEDESLDIAGGEGLVAGVELEKPEDVVFVPAARVDNVKIPHFVEVTSENYVLQPGDQNFPVTDLESRRNSPLRQFLSKVDKKNNTEYIVFLIHENGIKQYDKIVAFLKENHADIRMGKEPFTRGWLFIRRPPK